MSNTILIALQNLAGYRAPHRWHFRPNGVAHLSWDWGDQAVCNMAFDDDRCSHLLFGEKKTCKNCQRIIKSAVANLSRYI